MPAQLLNSQLTGLTQTHCKCSHHAQHAGYRYRFHLMRERELASSLLVSKQASCECCTVKCSSLAVGQGGIGLVKWDVSQ